MTVPRKGGQTQGLPLQLIDVIAAGGLGGNLVDGLGRADRGQREAGGRRGAEPDPLIIRVFSSRLGVSASLAACVWLEVCTPDRCAMRKQALK